MDSSTKAQIREYWDEFADDYTYSNEDGEEGDYREVERLRQDRLGVIRRILDEFQSQDLDVRPFREQIDSESKAHNLWGFRGMSLMFFNMLRNEAREQDRLDEVATVLREVLDVPGTPGEASDRIDELVELVDDLKAAAENKQKAPQAGYIPAFLSYFWQIQAPDEVPIYYQSTRKAYRKRGIWSSVDDLGSSYESFWETTEEVREIIEEHAGEDIHLWEIEFVMLNAVGERPRSKPGPESEHGTYAAFEDDSRQLFPEEFAVDDPDLFFPQLDALLERIQNALKNGKHLLFVGAPGTGKTRLAKHVCRSTVGDAFEMTTATADWSTFDTIGGYQSDRESNLRFEPGVFLDQFQDVEGEPQNSWLVIDEINRADIDKAFGSLFTALTGEDVVLPFTDSEGNRISLLGSRESRRRDVAPHRYYIPEDWRLVATMNTLDKTSLYEMSYAFMRRWAFIHVPIPDDIDAELVEQYVTLWSGVEVDGERCAIVADMWAAINESRSIGPAIVEDIYRYLQTSPDDHAAPVALYVVPQLEGLQDDELVDFVERMAADTAVDRGELATFVGEFFGIPDRRFEG